MDGDCAAGDLIGMSALFGPILYSLCIFISPVVVSFTYFAFVRLCPAYGFRICCVFLLGGGTGPDRPFPIF